MVALSVTTAHPSSDKLAHARDAVLARLAARVQDDEPGAETVLEDALRERELW